MGREKVQQGKIMGTFFFRELLDIYSACKNSSEVVEAQNKWMENLEKQQQASNGENIALR